MSSASDKPLAKKLGIRRGQKIALLSPPRGYDLLLGELPEGVTVSTELKGGLDFVQLFAREKETLEREFVESKAKLNKDGLIWVSWQKGKSGDKKALSENAVREIGLRNGLVDVKICAVDQTWSALKFVIRAKDRHQFQ